MSKRSITKIIKEWNNITTTKKPKLKKSELNEIVRKEPNSLRAQLATNPYASILASPLRRCEFYKRIFPSKLLLRFGLAWHPELLSNWAFPTLEKTKGFGYYVKLQKKLLEQVQRGGHQAIFKGSAVYRTDMATHVESLLYKQTWTEFSKYSIDNYDVLLPTDNTTVWKPVNQSSASGYQCILMFDPLDKKMTHDLNHEINNQTNIPCYNMRQFWSTKEIDEIKSNFNINGPLTLGVPKRINTVQLAETLWRCRQFIHS